ncbi:MAG: ABC transporter substrate-binding protein [Candidatus Humimicrobiaceae bacterium]
MKKIVICVSVILLALFISACKPQEIKKPPDEVTVQLKWVHQAQFAGLYVAQDKGYYADENINVKFIEGTKDTNLVEQLISGQADFIITSPENLIISCSQGVPIKAIAAIYRRSPVAFVSMADSQIIQPRDFIGKILAVLEYRDSEIQFYALTKTLGLDISKMKLIPWNSNYTEFYNGDADVTYVYITAGLIKMQQKGYKLNLIWPGDYGIKFYSDSLVTTEKMISQNPDLVTRFIRATLKGWKDAIEDTESAVEITLKYAKIKDKDMQLAMMDAQVPLIHTGEDYIGWMKGEDWQLMYQTLLDQKLINAPMDYSKLYTAEFLNKIYEGKAE